MENSSAADESGGVEPPSNQNDNAKSQEQIQDSLQKDLDFIKVYAVGADQDVLHSLLLTEKDNPDRIECILNDILGLNILPELISDFKKLNYNVGDKRPSPDLLVNNVVDERPSSDLLENNVRDERSSFDSIVNNVGDKRPPPDSPVKDPNNVKKSKPSDSESVIDTEKLNQNVPLSLSSGETSHGNEEISRVQQNIAKVEEKPIVSVNGEISTSNSNNDLEETDMEDDAKLEFLNNITLMFPDADILFLIRETQNFKSAEEFSVFVDRVMRSHSYPKIGDVHVSWSKVTKDASKSNESGSAPAESGNEAAGSSKNVNYDTTIKPIIIKGLKTTPFVDSGDEKAKQDAVGGKVNVDIKTNNIDPLFSSAINHQHLMAEPLNFSLPLDQPAPQLVPINFKSDVPVVQISTIKPSPTLKNIEEEMQVVSSTSEDVDNAAAGPSTSRNVMPGPSTRPDLVQSWIQSTALLEQTKSIQNVESAGRNETAVTLPLSAEEAAKTLRWVEEQTVNLVRIFPNTDPTFLKTECVKMKCSELTLNEFVIAKLEYNDMPTRVEYEKRIAMETLRDRYTKNFVIEDFLKAVPDPWNFFSDTKRDCSKFKDHSLSYLTASFRELQNKDIEEALSRNNDNLYLSYQHLAKNLIRRGGSGERTEIVKPTTADIQFLQEVAFIENEDKIKEFVEARRLEKELKYEEAKKNKNFYECQRCFDNELLVEDIVYCPKDHNFCKNCVVRNVEVKLEDRRNEFRCFLRECKTPFSLPSLQRVLKPDVFAKVLKAVQQEELKAAGIEGLEYCPFCDAATILDPEEKVMSCLNPECLKESCRNCKELSHIPLRCDEARRAEDGEVDIGFAKELPPLQEGIHDVTYEFGDKIEAVMNRSVLSQGGYGLLGYLNPPILNQVGYKLAPINPMNTPLLNPGGYALAPAPLNTVGNASADKVSMFRVNNVKRIFYPDKYFIYKFHQQEIEKKKPPPLGFEIDCLADWMKPILNKNVNEFFLFHGTQTTQIDIISKGGFDDRLSKGGLYGRGTYFAENADKAHKYVSSTSHTKYMFLARVTLGRPYKARQRGTWIRPPEISVTDPSQGLYDSIIGISSRKNPGLSGTAQYQEFVLFDRYQCFPEFVIEYTINY